MNKRTIFLSLLLALLLAPIDMEARKKAKKEVVPQLMNYPSAEIDKNLLHGGDVVIQVSPSSKPTTSRASISTYPAPNGAICRRSSISLASPSSYSSTSRAGSAKT